MVDLEPVPEEDELLEKLHHQGGDLENHGRVDVTRRHDPLRRRAPAPADRRTTCATRARTRARTILDDWAAYLPKFVKVMPVEYRRALQEMEKAQAGSDGMSRREDGVRDIGVMSHAMKVIQGTRPMRWPWLRSSVYRRCCRQVGSATCRHRICEGEYADDFAGQSCTRL